MQRITRLIPNSVESRGNYLAINCKLKTTALTMLVSIVLCSFLVQTWRKQVQGNIHNVMYAVQCKVQLPMTILYNSEL